MAGIVSAIFRESVESFGASGINVSQVCGANSGLEDGSGPASWTGTLRWSVGGAMSIG